MKNFKVSCVQIASGPNVEANLLEISKYISKSKKLGADIVILGTCYEEYQGLLDVSEENLGEVLRKLGYKAINLSKAGSSILSNFAALKEYGEPLNPKVTLLFYHDKDDLVSARKISMFSDKTSHPESPILLRYLNEDNFTQNLILKQDNIDSLLIKFLKSEF